MTRTAVRLGGDLTGASVASQRWQRARLPVFVTLLVLLTVAVAALVRPTTSAEPLAVDNPQPTGTRALAQVLEDQGVEVTQVRSVAAAAERADAGTTLAVVTSWLLSPEDVAALGSTDADLVLLGVEGADVDRLTGGTVGLVTGLVTGVVPGSTYAAACDVPAAVAARSVAPLEAPWRALSATGDATLCFPVSAGPTAAGLLASTTADGRPVTVLDDTSLLTNENITSSGNAALALTVLGTHDRLTWLLPSAEIPLPEQTSIGDLLPAWTGPAAALAAVVALGVALWRGRALGPVVSEPLPVVVRSSETVRGRGRLYRRGRSRGHAAAALRAGAAHRSAVRLGLPRSADAGTLIDALTRATGRPSHEVAALLYGPPPTDDAAFLALAQALDQLESEVHHT
jgi:hypothetical protein